MTPEDYATMSRHERADIVLRADLRRARIGDASPAVAKMVLVVLDSFPPDRCFPSEELIARTACTTTRTLRRIAAGLTEGGLLSKTPRRMKGTRYRSPYYWHINYDELAALDPRIWDDETEEEEGEPALANMADPGSQPRPNWPASPGHIGQPALANMATNNSMVTTAWLQQHVCAEPDAAPSHPASERWICEIAPALIRLGVSRSRIGPLCRAAGSRERVLEVLDLMQRRASRIKNPGGYFAKAISHGWK